MAHNASPRRKQKEDKAKGVVHGTHGKGTTSILQDEDTPQILTDLEEHS